MRNGIAAGRCLPRRASDKNAAAAAAAVYSMSEVRITIFLFLGLYAGPHCMRSIHDAQLSVSLVASSMFAFRNFLLVGAQDFLSCNWLRRKQLNRNVECLSHGVIWSRESIEGIAAASKCTRPISYCT